MKENHQSDPIIKIEQNGNTNHTSDGAPLEYRKNSEAPALNHSELNELSISLFKWAIGI